jgi:hypothetical protein
MQTFHERKRSRKAEAEKTSSARKWAEIAKLFAASLPRCWEEIDRQLQHSLLILRSSPRSLDTDAQIITLHTRLGGLGILSFEEVAPHVRAAAIESADRFLSADHFLAPLLNLPIFDEDAPLTSQRTRCAKVLEERQASLLSSLPPHLQESMHENASLLGRLALEAIPTSKAFHLSNRQVSAALHHHTLCPSSDDTCRCGEPNDFGHAEICPSFEPATTERHEETKRAMITLLKSLPNIQVDREPCVLNSPNPLKPLRTDFRVISGEGITEYDVSIVSIAAQKARTSSNQARKAAESQDPPPSTSDLAKLFIQNILTRRANEKKKLYGPLLNVPFAPLCMTVGGMIEKEAMEAMEGWKEAVGEGGYQFMMRRISIFLARARAKVWRFD